MLRHIINDVGCPQCDVLVLRGVHICEHGVTPAPTFERSFTTTIDAETARAWFGEREAPNA